MFKMRREQKAAFRERVLCDYETRVLAHVDRCFPERRATLGEGGVREVIRLGVDRAAAHGITTEREVCKFIDLMLVFGIDFDQQQAWAKEALEAGGRDPFAKVSQLYERAIQEET